MFILWLFWLFRWINIKPTISFINYLDLKKRNILIFTESAFNHFVRFTNVNSLMFVGLYFFFKRLRILYLFYLQNYITKCKILSNIQNDSYSVFLDINNQIFLEYLIP